MFPQTIGIVGGAGPLAGAFLLERILRLCSSLYFCYKDADFPQVILISFPFSDMLSAKVNAAQVRQELSHALSQLRNCGATVLAIACNTLHAFLDENEGDLIHLPQVLKEEISSLDLPLVFCTSTSVKFGLHKRFFPCVYPCLITQVRIDGLIDRILKGEDENSIIKELSKLLEAQNANTVVLGCTELSLFTQQLLPSQKIIIDPLEIMAKKILEKSFFRERL